MGKIRGRAGGSCNKIVRWSKLLSAMGFVADDSQDFQASKRRIHRLSISRLATGTLISFVLQLPQEIDASADEHADDGPDGEFGGPELRAVLEKRLVRKIDTRMAILVVIYILNYVCYPSPRLLTNAS